MKNTKKRTKFFGTWKALIVLFGITALGTLMFTACPNASGGNTGGGSNPSPQPVTKYKVTFSVEGSPANGSLSATVDGAPIDSGAMVEKGKTVIFTAVLDSGYMVENWTGITAPSPNATEVKHTLTEELTVQVKFKTLPAELFTVVIVTNDGGTVSANPALLPGNKAAKDTILTLTATPDEYYLVEKWAVGPNTALIDGGTTSTPLVDGDKLKGRFGAPVPAVAEPTKEGYIFKGWNPPLPETFPAENPAYVYRAEWEQKQYLIDYIADVNGMISANAGPDAGQFVEYQMMWVKHGDTVKFTAKPNDGFMVQHWSIDNSPINNNAFTYEITFTKRVEVKVKFTPIVYTKVPYSNLEAYLAGVNSEINYIEITGTIPVADFKGNPVTQEPGALGQKIKRYPSKKVALKLPQNVPGLTDMTSCFAGCTNLLSLKNIPSGVTNMSLCFNKCSNFTEAPVIPPTVNNMKNCFSKCSKLTKAPVIPSSVTNMALCFHSTALTEGPDIPASVTDMKQCFGACVSIKRVKLNCNYSVDGSKESFLNGLTLEPGGIQVPSAYYDDYVDPPSLYNMYVPGDTMEEKRAKFSRF